MLFSCAYELFFFTSPPPTVSSSSSSSSSFVDFLLLPVKLNSGVNDQGWNATLGPIRDPSSKTSVDLLSLTCWSEGTKTKKVPQTGGKKNDHHKINSLRFARKRRRSTLFFERKRTAIFNQTNT